MLFFCFLHKSGANLRFISHILKLFIKKLCPFSQNIINFAIQLEKKQPKRLKKMIEIDKAKVEQKYEELSAADFIVWITDEYLAAIGGSLNADNMDMLSAAQHSHLCYRCILDEVMEGGFIQLIMNGFAPYVLEGPFPYVVKKEWEMKDFSKLLYSVKSEYHRHKEELEKDMSDEEFMALYEQLEDLNEMGDDFLDDYQEEVSPKVAEIIMESYGKE